MDAESLFDVEQLARSITPVRVWMARGASDSLTDSVNDARARVDFMPRILLVEDDLE